MTRRLPFLIPLVFLASSLSAAPAVDHRFKLDHFGYRPSDTKFAFATADPGATVEVRDASDNAVFTVPADGGAILSRGLDGVHSQDNVWWVEFSSFSAPGTYRLFAPAWGTRSYDFEVREDVYNAPGRAAMKAFYYQRCGTSKPASCAGGNWSDAATCHAGDASLTAQAGHVDRGILSLPGGWHDAGDYNKYVLGSVSTAMACLFTAFEENPGKMVDGDLILPESGNGVPDLLDELKWELDWMLGMQLPDGSVLSQVHAADGDYTWGSPPSADPVVRHYLDPTLESGGVFTGSTALASRLFAARGQAAYAAVLKSAAVSAWGWLSAQSGVDTQKVWAAAELYRLDPTVPGTKTVVDSYAWNPWWLDIDSMDWWAASAYLQSPSPTASVAATLRSAFSTRVATVFDYDDLYRAGMIDFQYYWGSNRSRALYGLFLLQAVKLGQTGGHPAAECREKARDYLHWMHGRNALNMLYLTNMSAFGGEHSSYQIYHGWFGAVGNAYSRANHVGKPPAVVEPDYPYFKGTDNVGVNDNKSSNYGPAPGIVPGGPNAAYPSRPDATPAVPPYNAGGYDKWYRDWADQSVWQVMSWEITEPSLSDQAPYAALALYHMALPAAPPTATATSSPSSTFTWTATPSPTGTDSSTPTPSLTATASFTETSSNTRTHTPSSTWTSTFTPSQSATESPTSSWTPTFTPHPSSPIPHYVVWPNPWPGGEGAGTGSPLKVGFHLEEPAGGMALKVFTVSSRLVLEFKGADFPAGDVELEIEPRHLKTLANGVYLLVLETPGARKTWKLLILK